MKKLVLVVASLLFIAPAVLADNWGASVKLGVGENDPATMKEKYDYYGGELTKGYGIFGLEALYEWDLNDEANKIGAKVGLDVYGENEWKYAGEKVTEDTYAFPVTVYYKRDNGIKAWSYYGGAGLTFLRAELEATGGKQNKDKTVPHLMVGGEYRFTKLFALGAELKYNFSAKVKENNEVLSDRSGVSGSVVCRFYF
ncbi:MAG: outer membrane beta-barrel protein [Elusimicrobiaceae bacterium]|nr:outer membrane beta-barrel protein [Elusimicrobiaceae bacterium]